MSLGRDVYVESRLHGRWVTLGDLAKEGIMSKKEDHATYMVPKYELTTDGLKQSMIGDQIDGQFITFVNQPNMEGHQQVGTLPEHVLSALIGHLQLLNDGELRNRHTSIAITNMEIASMCLEEAEVASREYRGVEIMPGNTMCLLPTYGVRGDGGLFYVGNGIRLGWVSGDRNGAGTSNIGVISESLLSMLIVYYNTLPRSRYIALAITYLEEARMWLEERKRDRELRGVLGTQKS